VSGVVLRCPCCGRDNQSQVLFSEIVPDGLRRRRRCMACFGRFFTLEVMRGMRVVRLVVAAETMARGTE
jgi:transcriptional regulator NrdR family protein